MRARDSFLYALAIKRMEDRGESIYRISLTAGRGAHSVFFAKPASRSCEGRGDDETLESRFYKEAARRSNFVIMLKHLTTK